MAASYDMVIISDYTWAKDEDYRVDYPNLEVGYKNNWQQKHFYIIPL